MGCFVPFLDEGGGVGGKSFRRGESSRQHSVGRQTVVRTELSLTARVPDYHHVLLQLNGSIQQQHVFQRVGQPHFAVVRPVK